MPHLCAPPHFFRPPCPFSSSRLHLPTVRTFIVAAHEPRRLSPDKRSPPRYKERRLLLLLPSPFPLGKLRIRDANTKPHPSPATAYLMPHLRAPPHFFRSPRRFSFSRLRNPIVAARDSHRLSLEKQTLPRSKDRDAPPHPSTLLPSQALGLVVAAQANFMRVVVSEPARASGEELLCVVRALLKKIGWRVVVGDRVLVGGVDWTEGRGMVEEAFRRETEMVDPPVANVDHLLVLFSLSRPEIEPHTLTRFLVEAESNGMPVTLAINKADLVSKDMIKSWEERLHSWGYSPIFCSVEMGYGLASLMEVLTGRTTVIVGPSGVGKSSLINAVRGHSDGISGSEVNNLLNDNEGKKWSEYQPVGSVSEKSGKGRHTTRHVSLLPLPEEGYLVDTPGFNQPGLTKVTKKSLAGTFPEIRQMLSAKEPFRCSFNDCLHLSEPGCLITGDWERYPHYIKLLGEIKTREEKKLRTLGTKRESNVRYKHGELGVKQAEPRLNSKKHRRVSRKRLNESLLDEFMDED